MKSLFILFVLAFSVSCDDLATASQKISVALYKELIKSNENLVVSPFALQNLLALVVSGADGTTAEEIREVFKFDDTNEEVESEMSNLLTTIKKDRLDVGITNKIYVNDTSSIKKDFVSIAQSTYDAEIEESSSASLAFGNYILFRGSWTTPFLNTTTQNFTVGADKLVEYEPLYLESVELNYAESEELDAKIIEIPFYRSSHASMVIVLPNEYEGLARIEENIALALTTPEFNKQFVEVTIPDFQIVSILHLASTLQNLGITTAFDTEANFSGITTNSVHLDEILQDSVVQFGAYGLGAPYNTEIDAEKEDMFAPIANRTFLADHPFFFYAKLYDVVLLEGRLLQP